MTILGVWGSGRAFLGVWRMVLWYHGRSMVVPWYCQGRTRVPGAILSIANAYASHPGANVEGRMKNAECHVPALPFQLFSMSAFQLLAWISHPKPSPCD